MTRRFLWALTARFTRATGSSPSVVRGAGRDAGEVERGRGWRTSARAACLALLGVGRRHDLLVAEPAGARRRLVLEQVVAARAAVHELAAAGHPEALLRAAVGLHLGHRCLVSSVGRSVAGRRACGGSVLVGCGAPDRLGCAGLAPAARCAPAVRRHHHDHVAAVLLRRGLDEAQLLDVVGQPLQQPEPELRPGLLATAEHDRDLDFVTGLQEPHDVTLLGLVVVRVDLRPKLHLLDDGVRLVASRFASLLGVLVLPLAVVHELADRRPGFGATSTRSRSAS